MSTWFHLGTDFVKNHSNGVRHPRLDGAWQVGLRMVKDRLTPLVTRDESPFNADFPSLFLRNRWLMRLSVAKQECRTADRVSMNGIALNFQGRRCSCYHMIRRCHDFPRHPWTLSSYRKPDKPRHMDKISIGSVQPSKQGAKVPTVPERTLPVPRTLVVLHACDPNGAAVFQRRRAQRDV